jgi:integrase
MALTDRKLRSLQPREKRFLLSDGRGLSLDVTPQGVMTWLFRYRHNGSQLRVTLGRFPDLSLKAARDRRDELASEVARGKSPHQQAKDARAGRSSNLTVRVFAERYYNEQVLKNRKDPLQVRRYLDKEILPAFGDKLITEINVLDVQTLVYRKRDNGQVQAAIQLRGVIKLIFDYALHEQVALINPASMVATRYIGRPRKRARVLNQKEIRLYLDTIHKSNIRRQFKLALHILLLTLKRKSELLLARWEDVNFKTGEWTIPAGNAKTGKPSIVYMSTQVKEMFEELQALAGDSQLVLPGRGSLVRPFAKNALNKAVEGLSFDMDPLTIHDLRRTGASLLTEKGFEKDVIEKALSHEKEGIRAIYIIAEHADERKHMLQWWADYVDGIRNESNVLTGNFKRA